MPFRVDVSDSWSRGSGVSACVLSFVSRHLERWYRDPAVFSCGRRSVHPRAANHRLSLTFFGIV